MLAHNLNRDVREVRLFEQGTVFTGSAEQVVESPSLSLGLTGELPPTRLHSSKDAAVFELKAVIESLLSLFAASVDALSTSAASALAFSPDAPAWLEPGRSATALLNGAPIACFGELAASQREARKLRQPVFLAQLDLDALYRLPLRRAAARELSRFQAVERDFSFTFADAVQWRTIAQAIAALAIPELTRLHPGRDIPRREGWFCIGRKIFHPPALRLPVHPADPARGRVVRVVHQAHRRPHRPRRRHPNLARFLLPDSIQ